LKKLWEFGSGLKRTFGPAPAFGSRLLKFWLISGKPHPDRGPEHPASVVIEIHSNSFAKLP
jgi:hypothetical protein